MKLIKCSSVLVLHRCCKRYCSGIQMYSVQSTNSKTAREFSSRTRPADYNHLVGNNQQTPACILILLRKNNTEFHYFQLLGSFINSLRQ